MSVSASIDIELAWRKEIVISKVRLIEKLLDFGWTFNDNGQGSYLPIDDKEDFNWQRENISPESLMLILKEKEKCDELIGVAMTWEKTGIGGEFLLMSNGVISINLSINRKLFNADIVNTKIMDVNWYLTRLLPVFNQEDIKVESFSYQECV